jgi:hypothetical protein
MTAHGFPERSKGNSLYCSQRQTKRQKNKATNDNHLTHVAILYAERHNVVSSDASRTDVGSVSRIPPKKFVFLV